MELNPCRWVDEFHHCGDTDNKLKTVCFCYLVCISGDSCVRPAVMGLHKHESSSAASHCPPASQMNHKMATLIHRQARSRICRIYKQRHPHTYSDRKMLGTRTQIHINTQTHKCSRICAARINTQPLWRLNTRPVSSHSAARGGQWMVEHEAFL